MEREVVNCRNIDSCIKLQKEKTFWNRLVIQEKIYAIIHAESDRLAITRNDLWKILLIILTMR